MNKTPKISAGIVAYKNPKKQLEMLIKSLTISANEANIKLEISILGNDEEPRKFNEKEVTYETSKNIGFGRAHNKIMEAAFKKGADYYLCINPDGFLHHAAIEKLISLSAHCDDSALIEAIQVPIQHPKPFNPITLETPWISGACFLIPKKIYEEIGGFDEDIFMYCEDVDISWRAKYHGFCIKTEPRAMFYHNTSGRKRNLILERELMLAGRYLGAKYSCPDFSAWVEDAMVANGLINDKRSLPPLTPSKTYTLNPEIVEFRNSFNFSFARW